MILINEEISLISAPLRIIFFFDYKLAEHIFKLFVAFFPEVTPKPQRANDVPAP